MKSLDWRQIFNVNVWEAKVIGGCYQITKVGNRFHVHRVHLRYPYDFGAYSVRSNCKTLDGAKKSAQRFWEAEVAAYL